MFLHRQKEYRQNGHTFKTIAQTATGIQMSIAFLIELEETILKFMSNQKGPRRPKATLGLKNK